ncbi:MAG: hypothetical protein P8163_13075 [Candidatus Thiodiazotropha sp.]
MNSIPIATNMTDLVFCIQLIDGKAVGVQNDQNPLLIEPKGVN